MEQFDWKHLIKKSMVFFSILSLVWYGGIFPINGYSIFLIYLFIVYESYKTFEKENIEKAININNNCNTKSINEINENLNKSIQEIYNVIRMNVDNNSKCIIQTNENFKVLFHRQNNINIKIIKEIEKFTFINPKKLH